MVNTFETQSKERIFYAGNVAPLSLSLTFDISKWPTIHKHLTQPSRPGFSQILTQTSKLPSSNKLTFVTETLFTPTSPTSYKPASLSEMPWLAKILLFSLFLSNFKTDFEGAKSRVGLLNQYNVTSYQSFHLLVSQKCLG